MTTRISWTDETWNPTVGCTRVSPGCENCYAEKMAWRLRKMDRPEYVGLTVADRGNGSRWSGKVRCLPDRLGIPLHWRKPRRVFVDSMSDLFHESVPDEFIDDVFAVMALCPQHTFQILTKRADRMRKYGAQPGKLFEVHDAAEIIAFDEVTLAERSGKLPLGARWVGEKPDQDIRIEMRWPLLNVHLGVSVEDQKRADERIPELLETPAAVRFLSCEPLLGPVSLVPSLPCVKCLGRGWYLERFSDNHKTACAACMAAAKMKGVYIGHGQHAVQGPRLDWVIVGGESGPSARPCNVEWIRSIVEQCKAAGTACYVKQLGAKPEGPYDSIDGKGRLLKSRSGSDPDEWPKDLRVQEFPK